MNQNIEMKNGYRKAGRWRGALHWHSALTKVKDHGNSSQTYVKHHRVIESGKEH